MATLKEIYSDVQGINPKVSTISSIGNFVDENAKQVAQSIINRVTDYLPENSLAMKIIRDKVGFGWSERQIWVICYELQKNAEYCKELDKTLNDIKVREDAKKAQRRIKRQAKETAKKEIAERLQQYNEANSNKVMHQTFGEGNILEQDEQTITIDFNGTTKKLLKKFAPIKFIA